ncbi:MAG: SDR family NAD(P)-dependent oxidoreductase [Candidatus Thorarchaeota archaeon]
MKDLKGKTCFLTGAASGIGCSFAKALAKEDMKLFITDINIEGLENVKNDIERIGAKVYSMKCDVSKLTDLEAAANQFYSKFGDVDLLINNAGIGLGDDLANMDLEVWKSVFDVNLWSVIYSLKVFLPRMLIRKTGHIVNVASAAGIFGSTEPLPYITSKFAVVGLSEGIYSRLKRQGIKISVITPTLIKTEIFHSGFKKIKYSPNMLKKYGKEKLDEVYGAMLDKLINSAMSPDLAVKKYIRQIKKDNLYIFDSKGPKDIFALKGRDLNEYENFLVNYQETQNKGMIEHLEKHGIKVEDFMLFS